METMNLPAPRMELRPLGGLVVQLARDPQAVREGPAPALAGFAEELGAKLHSSEPGCDQDGYDRHCEHLLVREAATGDVVACTRLLFDHRAAGPAVFTRRASST